MRTILSLITGFILILTSCSIHNDQPLYTIQPPLDNIVIQPTTVQIDPSKEQVVRFKNGISVDVPADAFCDEDGNPVKGNVELSLQTYDSKAAILASGIPMKYTENGSEADFESAGMFKLEGSANNKKIEIRKDKKLSINYPSKTFGDFDFFYFEEAQVKQSGFSTVSEPANATGSWKKLSPPQPETADLSKTVKTFQLQFDSKNYNELQPLEKIKWNLATRFLDPTSQRNKWALNQKWTSLEISQPKWGFMDPVFEHETDVEPYMTYGRVEISQDNQTIITTKQSITTVWSAKSKQVFMIDQVKTDYNPVQLIDNRYFFIDKNEGTALYTVEGKKLAVYKDCISPFASVKKQRVLYEKPLELNSHINTFILADFSGKQLHEFKLKDDEWRGTGSIDIYATAHFTPDDHIVTNSLEGISVYDFNGNLLYAKKENFKSVEYLSPGKLLCEDLQGGLLIWDFKLNKITKAPITDFSLNPVRIDNHYYFSHTSKIDNTPFIIVDLPSKNYDSHIVWNYETNTSYPINFNAYSIDSLAPEIVCGYSLDGTYHLYNLKQRKELLTIPNFKIQGESMHYSIFSKDKSRLLINGYSHIRLYNSNYQLLRDFKSYDSLITVSGFLNNTIFTISSDGVYQRWDMNGKQLAGTAVQLENNGASYYYPVGDEKIGRWNTILHSFDIFDTKGKLQLSLGKSFITQIDSTYLVQIRNRKYCDISPLFKPEKGMYQLTLSADSLEFFTYVYLDEETQTLIDTYNTFKAKRISAEKDRQQQEVKLLRRFEIAKFGIYNWDKIIKRENSIVLEADFKFDTATDFNHIMIFMITDVNGPAVIKYYKEQWKNFVIDPTLDSKLVAILPDNRIALFTNEELKKINWEEVKKNKKYRFQMKSVPGKIENLEMLERYL